METTGTREIAASVDRTLTEEARRNELLIAYARAIAASFMAVMDTISYFFPAVAMGQKEIPLWLPAVSGTAALISLAIMLVLRAGVYRNSFRYAIPMIDAGLIIVGFLGTRQALGQEFFLEIGGLGSAAIACGLLTSSGALRLTRSAAAFTALAGIVAFLITTHGLQTPTPNLGIQLGLLVAVGTLSVWMTRIVERAVKSEVGRVMLARFLPRHVIDGAHSDPLNLLTRARKVNATVVVTDLRGFTAFSETLSPDEVLGFLNEVQGALARVVRRYGGTVDKFLGDGMLAVFGAPEPIDDHAVRAVCAAGAVLQVVDDLNKRRTTAGHQPVRIGVGVHSGALVAGCLGSGLRLEFTIVGDTVNTASRLESMTKANGVTTLISTDTMQLAEAAFGATGQLKQSAVEESLARAETEARDQNRERTAVVTAPTHGHADHETKWLDASQLVLPRVEVFGELEIRGRTQPLEVYTLSTPPPSQTRILRKTD